MTNRWDAWKAQEPPDDFASRTVTAALAERARGQRIRRLARRRAAAASAVAAVMFAGMAWGFSAWKTRLVSERRPSAAPGVVTEGVRPTSPPVTMPVARASVEAPSASTALPPAPSPPIRRRIDAGALPDAGRKVRVPPCACSPHEEMCTCF